MQKPRTGLRMHDTPVVQHGIRASACSNVYSRAAVTALKMRLVGNYPTSQEQRETNLQERVFVVSPVVADDGGGGELHADRFSTDWHSERGDDGAVVCPAAARRPWGFPI